MVKGWSFVGASMVEEEEGEKQREGEGERELSENVGLSEERESCFLVLKGFFPLFLSFYYKLCHMSPFEWSKKGPLSLLIVTHTQPQKVRKT